MSQAEIDVLAERQRQIHAEGWDEAHDDQWDENELIDAAVCYAKPECIRFPGEEITAYQSRETWPIGWDRSWWKPTTIRRNLVKAAALIIAEIDRLDRRAISP